MRAIVAMIMTLGLAACADEPSADGGVATYDALRLAQKDCAAKGGALVLKKDGDSQYIGDYACKGK
jgi:hypothetical protein